MRKQIFRPWVMAGILFFSFYMVLQAQAGIIQKNTHNEYNLDDQNYKTSLRASVGYLTGTANELVYQGSFSENYLSKLIWEIDEQYMVGLGFSFQKQWVALHGDAWFGVTDGDGTMDDYDWLVDNAAWSDWSHHDDTSVTQAQIYDINFEFLIPRISGKHFVLSAFLGYKYETYELEARGGSYTYTETTFRDTTGTFTPGELGITYEQIYKTPYIGLGFHGNIENFEVSGRFICSTLASGESHDLHHLRNLGVRDRTVDGDMYSFNLSASYRFLESYTLEISYNYTSYDEMVGNSKYSEVVDGQIDAIEYYNAGGMDLETSMVSLSLIYSF